MFDFMLGGEMRNGRRVLPAVLVSASLHAAVDKVLDASLYRAVNHCFALPDLTLVGDAFALRNLHAVHSPDGTGGDFGGAGEERGHIVHVALHELDVAALGSKLLGGATGRVAGYGQESEFGVVGEVFDHTAALLAGRAGHEDSLGHDCRSWMGDLICGVKVFGGRKLVAVKFGD